MKHFSKSSKRSGYQIASGEKQSLQKLQGLFQMKTCNKCVCNMTEAHKIAAVFPCWKWNQEQLFPQLLTTQSRELKVLQKVKGNCSYKYKTCYTCIFSLTGDFECEKMFILVQRFLLTSFCSIIMYSTLFCSVIIICYMWLTHLSIYLYWLPMVLLPFFWCFFFFTP